MNDEREAAISVVENGRGMPVCESHNEEIGYDEIGAIVVKLKGVRRLVWMKS